MWLLHVKRFTEEATLLVPLVKSADCSCSCFALCQERASVTAAALMFTLHTAALCCTPVCAQSASLALHTPCTSTTTQLSSACPYPVDFSNRRYAFRQQPSIGQWNLCRLAESLIAGGLFSKV